MSEPKNCLVCGEPIPRRAYQASWVRTCGPVCASDLAHRENPDLDKKCAQKRAIPGLDGGRVVKNASRVALMRASQSEETVMSKDEEKETTLTDEQRRTATKMVIGLIVTSCGQAAADYWAWERTPMPAGFPLDDQLLEGLKMAARGTRPGPWHCPCQTDAENPGPHIAACPWSDPEYEPAFSADHMMTDDPLDAGRVASGLPTSDRTT